jgi:hypothetical protein
MGFLVEELVALLKNMVLYFISLDFSMTNEHESSNNNDTTMATVEVGAEATISAADMFYDGLVTKMLARVNLDDDGVTPISRMVSQATETVTKTTHQPFSTSRFTESIARKLLLLPTKSDPPSVMGMSSLSSNAAPSVSVQQDSVLKLVQVLAKIDASLYLPSLAASVNQLIVQDQYQGYVSSSLLQLWMQQLTQTDSVAVHSHLVEALVVLSQRDSSIMTNGLTLLVQIWSSSIQQSQKDASIVNVRCATLWIEWVAKLGGAVVLAANQQSQDLFVQMIQNFDDPLQQLTLMDLLIEHFGPGCEESIKAEERLQEWLASPSLLSPILQMLQDPLLAGASMNYLSGVLMSLRPDEMQLVLDHIRRCGTVTNETERLQTVHALSNISTSGTAVTALPIILQDPTLRHAWWDNTRISQPKLQSAILMSVALALPKINSIDASLAMTLYNALGPDNYTNSSSSVCSTQWLLERFVASPIPELRIGAYAVLAAMLRLQAAGRILALHTPKFVQSNLLELCTDPEWRDSSSEARVAYFDVLEGLYGLLTNSTASSSASVWLVTMQEEQRHKVTQQLQKKVKMGPHGREPKRWDVALE